MSTFSFYLITENRALEIKEEVVKAISNWKKVASKYKILSSEIVLKARAFKTE